MKNQHIKEILETSEGIVLLDLWNITEGDLRRNDELYDLVKDIHSHFDSLYYACAELFCYMQKTSEESDSFLVYLKKTLARYHEDRFRNIKDMDCEKFALSFIFSELKLYHLCFKTWIQERYDREQDKE